MLAQTMESTRIVFSKTEKGRDEMSRRVYGLNPMQRRLLIIIDGSKDLDSIMDMIPAMVSSGQLQEIISFLLEQGFIVATEGEKMARSHLGGLSNAVASVPTPAPISAPALAAVPARVPPSDSGTAVAGAALTEDPATIRLVKDFMTTTAQTYLGLLSAPVIQRIEQTRTAAQLMAVAGHWNMALRDSPQGKRFASPYLDQVKAALVDGTMPLLGEVN